MWASYKLCQVFGIFYSDVLVQNNSYRSEFCPHLQHQNYQLNFCDLAAAKSLQSCTILCDPIDGSPPCSAIPGILQARTLEWVAISFSNTWQWKVKVRSLSRVRLFATPWTAAHQAPPSMGFSRQEYWSGVQYSFLIKGLSIVLFSLYFSAIFFLKVWTEES